MKKFLKQLNAYEKLMFLDLEGTQESHELIALSAIIATLDKNRTIAMMSQPFTVFVKPQQRIGHYVKKLTGITRELLDEKGVTYAEALNQLVAFTGGHETFDQLAFVTFGNHDLRIFHQSLVYSPDADVSVVKQIASNYIDLSVIISEFVKDENGNPLSLINYCTKFEIPFTGTPHDPYYDALNLAYLYDAFLKREDIVFQEYKETLKNMRKLPTPIKNIVHTLLKGETVTPDDLDNEVRQYITPFKGKK